MNERYAGFRTGVSAVLEQIRSRGVEVRDSQLHRSLYASDASVYRVTPAAVALPRTTADVESIVAFCQDAGVPITSRGAGTSIAGNAVGPGVIVDFSRHLNQVLSIDTDRRSARVQPGTSHASLQAAAARHRLRFGPDPSSHSRCTIGGMLGNNACGSRALGYGRTSDNVLGLHVLTAAGEHLRTGTLAADGQAESSATLDNLQSVVASSLATIRTELGTFGRQVSGYSLEHLLPENGFDVSKALVGSEGTLAVILEADMRLVEEPPHRLLLVLGYGDMVAAARDVPAVLPFGPTACEGLDRRITDVLASVRGVSAVPTLPAGGGWLFVELAGANLEELSETADRIRAASSAWDSRLVRHHSEMAALWKIREDGSGLVAKTPDGRPAHAGWEDAAVPPRRLGDYLADFESLLEAHGYFGVPYGHFGDGCVHVRIDFDLETRAGTARYREFLLEAAQLVGSYGGSISGEHGDGRARSELLHHMYSRQAIDLFARVKHVFDPHNVLNPGIVVDPAAVDDDVRYNRMSGGQLPIAGGPPSVRRPHASRPAATQQLAFLYPHDARGLAGAVHRCTGVGRCVAPNPGSAVMCPSFQATHDEKDSTRGRSRVLQDAVAGHLGPGGLKSPEVRRALDLCLACKGCRSDCPTGVDMATYKSEVLHQQHRGKVRPRSHYSLGRLPLWLRFARHVPAVFNFVNSINSIRRPLAWAAGIDPRRDVPRVGSTASRRAWRREASRGLGVRPSHGREQPAGKRVVLFADSFTDSFTPGVASAVVRLLRASGYEVHLPATSVCCGLTWISTGQLEGARRRLEHTVRTLEPYVARGMPVVGMEPSCTAALRSDLVELVDTPAAQAVSAAVVTLAELLEADPEAVLPDLTGLDVLAQPHCHHHAVMGWDADRRLLERCGAHVRTVGGCCGLAGNFGVERGHYEVSVAVAETQLLPAVRKSRPGTIVLADGFSCRMQLEALAEGGAIHLAELLNDRLEERIRSGGPA